MRFLTSSVLSMLDTRINSLGVGGRIRRPRLNGVKFASSLVPFFPGLDGAWAHASGANGYGRFRPASGRATLN